MDSNKKTGILAAGVVVSLLIVLVILFLCLGGPSKEFFVLVGVEAAVLVAVATWTLYHHCSTTGGVSIGRTLTSSMARNEELRIEYSFLRKVAGLPAKFKYEALESATDNFTAFLGRGSSATVFKGILDDGTPVAVKRIDAADRGDREFRAEVAAIASVQHVNLVRLLGYCVVPRGGPRFLVYDFIHNGSLDNWIFPGGDGRWRREGGCLPWALRYRVAVDVARGLSYLHHDCRSRILHLDVKPENILLDEGFRACVSDFGLSQLMGKEESRVVTTVRGTRGYLAPEWLLDCGITEKSDIYSYGMVLLEIVGGRRNVRLVGADDGEHRSKRKWSYFPRIVSEKVREGKIMEVVDERLVTSAGGGGGVLLEEKEVRVLVYVALWCIQERADLRPSMARVVDMLEGRIPVSSPPETDMVVADLLCIDQLGGGGGPTENGGDGASTSLGRRLDPPMSATYSFAMSTLSGR